MGFTAPAASIDMYGSFCGQFARQICGDFIDKKLHWRYTYYRKQTCLFFKGRMEGVLGGKNKELSFFLKIVLTILRDVGKIQIRC